MYAAFEFHSAINTVTTDLENNFLKASQFSRVGIHNFNAPAPSFCITGIHPKKYACKQSGFVTAGTASGINDAASGVILMSEEKAKEVGAPILARIVSVATTGVRPEVMGIGPISASQKALKKAGLTIDDIDLFEINEAFASQCIACAKTLRIDEDKLNVNGSGISLGHPVGATGSRLVVTLLHELKKRGEKYGLATLCAGGGMGTAVIIEMM